MKRIDIQCEDCEAVIGFAESEEELDDKVVAEKVKGMVCERCATSRSVAKLGEPHVATLEERVTALEAAVQRLESESPNSPGIKG